MTLKNFFVGRTLVLGILMILGVGFFIIKSFLPSDDAVAVIPAVVEQEGSKIASLAWKTEEAESLNPDGNQQTNLFLEIKYEDETVENKLIDTTDGGCSELPDVAEDSVDGTTIIQCYYAGLGFSYKITSGEETYLVQRKMFEEGSPEYTPPVQTYEVIAELSLVK